MPKPYSVQMPSESKQRPIFGKARAAKKPSLVAKVDNDSPAILKPRKKRVRKPKLAVAMLKAKKVPDLD